MSSQQAPKKVQDVQPAPVVSTDSTSPEAILARNAKSVQLQADSDSVFDTVLERFSASESDSDSESEAESGPTRPLLAVGLTLFGLGIMVFLSRKK
jgi:hypothetical protein